MNRIKVGNMDNMVNLCPNNSNKWFEIIYQNNEEEAKTLLAAATREKRDLMLNGNFDFGEIDACSNEWSYTTRKPLFLAAIFGSTEVLKLFDIYEANFCQVDEEQNNVVHSLISMCFSEPKYEGRCIAVFNVIMETISLENKKILLLSENRDGLRPLELAAHYSCLKFFKAILETPGVHISHIEQKGIQQQSWLDITEYESFETGNRRDRSVLMFLSLVEKRIFQDNEASNVFMMPVIKKWVKAKLLVNFPILFLWAIFRSIHVMTFYIVATAGGAETPRMYTINQSIVTTRDDNITTTTFNLSHFSRVTNCKTYVYYSKETWSYWVAVACVQVFGAIVVLFDILEVSINMCRKKYRWRKTPKGSKKCFVNETFYRFVQEIRQKMFH